MDRKRVFVTSASFTGSLGGLSGADARCDAAARQAGVRGSFTAWLSDIVIDARERIPGNGPWYRMDRSTVLFVSKAQLESEPNAAIDMTEQGGPVAAGTAVWTGTNNGGTRSFSVCDNWTEFQSAGRVGVVSTAGWTASGSISCSERARLYCFER
jgi:hypothetical protein